MKTILITGATGYIGGALAAQLLAAGARVIALSRNDADGARTRGNVQRSARGFGAELSSEAEARLSIVAYDLAQIPEAALREVDAVWHCAAEMSFASKRLESAFATNVGDTCALYQTLARLAPRRPRFYYVSTAYTGGIQASVIDEELHLSPRLVNPYFVTKWSAEMMLSELSRREGALPVTLFRPSIVVGHSATGWYGGKSFGPYNFIDAFHVSASLGNRSMRVDIDPDIAHNYLPIDVLIENAVALTLEPAAEPQLSILNVLGSEMPNRERTQIIAEEMRLEIELAPPRTVGDHALATWVFINHRFNHKPAVDGRFPLTGSNLKRLLGPRHVERPIDAGTFRRLIRWYCDHRLATVPRRYKSSAKVPIQLMRLLHASGLEKAMLGKRQAARLLLGGMARAYLE